MRRKKPLQNQVETRTLPLEKCLAKTYRTQSGEQKGHCVLDHCHIVGEVARELLSRFPPTIRQEFFPGGSELVAAAHDVGKVSPTFQEKIYKAVGESLGLADNPTIESNWGGHAGVSQAAVRELDAGKYIPEIVGKHHGFSPKNIEGKRANSEVFGGQKWQDIRAELVVKLKGRLSCDWPTVGSELQSTLLAGLTTVSDWIGSGFFKDPKTDWEDLIAESVNNAGFIRPIVAAGKSFSEIFQFESMNDSQKKLVDAVHGPGIYILESPMGVGKTEAALYAAYQALVHTEATGIYFALPTQVTSDRILDRVNRFLMEIIAPDCRKCRAQLLHGNAWLKQTEIGEEGQPGCSWFSAPKLGILAPFAVGTIDQALMSVVGVKHSFVRTFGLVGKVVILDEVHSYDVYTGTLLDKLVKNLYEMRCVVIILSATLSLCRRSQLLPEGLPAECTYPLVSALSRGVQFRELSVEPPLPKTVHLSHVQLFEAEEEALWRSEQGQQVLWIENTVDEAQKVYAKLAARTCGMNIKCGLLHSRFVVSDRSELEEYWVEILGKNGIERRAESGRILIGTQVLEQSLDIDADFLVTRFCPTDMLLQRIGRLWRHSATRRPPAARREAWIIAPPLEGAVDDPKESFGKTAYVYSPYVLCRSLEVWHGRSAVVLPTDIRALIEDTYRDRSEHSKMSQWKDELAEQIERMKSFARISTAKNGLNKEESATRYGEEESVQVLLLRDIEDSAEKIPRLVLLGETKVEITLPPNLKCKDKRVWRERSADILGQVVRVVSRIAPAGISRESIKWLGDYLYLGGKHCEESWVRVALVNERGQLLLPAEGRPVSEKYDLYYDRRMGYRAVKKTGGK